MNEFDSKTNVTSTYFNGILQAKAYRNLRNVMLENLYKYNLSLPEWAILGLIHDDPSIRLSTIGNILNVKAALITNLVKLLKKKGFLLLQKSKNDRRAKVIILSEKAIKLIPEIEVLLKQSLRELLSDVPLTDLLAYIRVLSIIANKKVKNRTRKSLIDIV